MPIIFTVCCAGYSGEAECCWLSWQKLTAPRTWDPCKSTQQSVFFSRRWVCPWPWTRWWSTTLLMCWCLSTNEGNVCLRLHLFTPADGGMLLIQTMTSNQGRESYTAHTWNQKYTLSLLPVYCYFIHTLFWYALNIMELDDARLVELKALKWYIFKKPLNKNRI